jgi:hypothetical protein
MSLETYFENTACAAHPPALPALGRGLPSLSVRVFLTPVAAWICLAEYP